MPQVGDHVVLNVTDALICQYEGGEHSMLHYSAVLNELWLSRDPVALDVLSLDELARQRKAGRVSEIKFLAKGCVPSIACASALTDLAKGKTLGEVHALTTEQLTAEVGWLPQASSHAAQLAIDALSTMLRDCRQGQ